MADPAPQQGRRLPWGRLGGLVLIAAAVWSSVWRVDQDEQGVVTRWGRVARVVTSGVHFTLPWPVEWMQRVSTSEVRTASLGVAAGGGAVVGEEAQWLTGDTNIFEMRVAIQYVVDDPAAYLFGVADLSDGRSRDEAVSLAVRAELTHRVARMRIDDALSVGKARLQSEAREGVQQLLDRLGMGIRVLAVNIAEARPPSDVIAAFNDVASAESDRQRMLSDADGFRRELVPKTRSQANALVQEAKIYKDTVVAEARGAAARFAAIAEQSRIRPDLSRTRLWLDAMSKILARAKTAIYVDDPERPFVLRVLK